MSLLRFWSMAHLPRITGGSATGLSATDACILSYYWPVMPETMRLFRAGVEQFRFVCDGAIGEHVKVVIVPLARGTRSRCVFEDQNGHAVAPNVELGVVE